MNSKQQEESCDVQGCMTHLSDKATDNEVLQAAIEKAIDGGWTYRKGWVFLDDWNGAFPDASVQFLETATADVWHVPYEVTIFNHEFLKALWPNPMATSKHDRYWQYHGTQMFLAKDRIDYLRRHLNEND